MELLSEHVVYFPVNAPELKKKNEIHFYRTCLPFLHARPFVFCCSSFTVSFFLPFFFSFSIRLLHVQAERKAERMDYRPSGDRQPSSDSAYFSSGNDNHGNVSDPSRSKPSGPSKQLTTLEKIMGRANMNVAEAKSE